MDLKSLKEYKCPWLIDEQEDDCMAAANYEPITEITQIQKQDLIKIYDSVDLTFYEGTVVGFDLVQGWIFYDLPGGYRKVALIGQDQVKSIKRPSLVKTEIKCECGAAHTSNKNHHMNYCPIGKWAYDGTF
jgi:hypothetical protein